MQMDAFFLLERFKKSLEFRVDSLEQFFSLELTVFVFR